MDLKILAGRIVEDIGWQNCGRVFLFTLLKAHFVGESMGSGAQLIGFWSQISIFSLCDGERVI